MLGRSNESELRLKFGGERRSAGPRGTSTPFLTKDGGILMHGKYCRDAYRVQYDPRCTTDLGPLGTTRTVQGRKLRPCHALPLLPRVSPYLPRISLHNWASDSQPRPTLTVHGWKSEFAFSILDHGTTSFEDVCPPNGHPDHAAPHILHQHLVSELVSLEGANWASHAKRSGPRS